mgnify:CR=1 FL=1
MEQQVIDSTEQEVQTADEPKTPTLKETLEAAVKGEDVLPEPPAEKMEEVQREEETAEQPEETTEEQVKEKKSRDETLRYEGRDTTEDAKVTLDREGRKNKAEAEKRQERRRSQSMGDYIAQEAKSDAASARTAEKRSTRDAEVQARKDEVARRNAMTSKERKAEDKAKRRAAKNA